MTQQSLMVVVSIAGAFLGTLVGGLIALFFIVKPMLNPKPEKKP